MDITDTARKKLLTEAEDLICQIGGIKDAIIVCVRSKISIDTQMRDIGRLTDREGMTDAYDAGITSTKDIKQHIETKCCLTYKTNHN